MKIKSLAKIKPELGIWMNEIPKPQVTYNDVLIKIEKTAICGTDMHIYQWDKWASATIPLGMTIGHEFVGRVVEYGRGVENFNEGDLVSGEGHIVCGKCRNCRAGMRHLCCHTTGVGVNRSGAFAEYLSIPASNVYPIPHNISSNLAAIFDPLGNAVHTALSFDLVGEDVLITGAGSIGIMSALVAIKAGARYVVLTDKNPYRLNLAKKIGVNYCINIEENSLNEVMTNLDMHEGFDVGLEMSGNNYAFQEMVNLMKHGGKIALLGIPPENTMINWEAVIFKGLFIKGIYGREIFETWYKMVSMIQSGLNIEGIITHQFKVDDYQSAFELMASGLSGKIILNW